MSSDFNMHKASLNCIAQGSLTNSKKPECFVKGVYPTHLKKAQGCHVWDYKNKRYIDFITALGTSIIGYGNVTVNNAAIHAINNGNLLSLGTEQEIKTAEKLKEVFPFVDHWKFLKTGNEACNAAIKIAREYTNEKKIYSDGYHGWLETPDVYPLKELENAKGAAAIIVEPVITDISDERKFYLRTLRDFCDYNGVLLIFDEIVTGFRFPRFSVSSYWGIEPDLICIGKAMANGFTLSAVGGKSPIMNSNYFVSSTYGGSMEALAACEKVVHELQTKYKFDELWEKGAEFIASFNSFWPSKIRIEGYPSRGVFKGDDIVKALFFQEACLAGILLGPSFFFNFCHIPESFYTLNTLKDILYRIKSGAVVIKGEMPQVAVAAKVRGA